MRIVVLGAGRVGSAIAVDLAAQDGWQVTVVDVSEPSLQRVAVMARVETRQADLADPGAVTDLVAGFDLAVSAVPGPMGFATLRAVIEAGVRVVDIAFFEEDPLELDELARRRGVTALVDCGIAPGCSNLILGYLQTVFEEVRSFACYVGGLPTVRRWPYEYRAVFSPIDVIAEYTRPARLVEGGEVVVRPALSDVEHLDFPGLGTLEAFNTDGLRSLLHTSRVPHMVEKTMRYPGHADKMRMLRETGFFGEEPVPVKGVEVRPLDLTAELLFPAWHMREDEEDLTAMRVQVAGSVHGRQERWTYDLLDRFDRATATTSMARTTGYTCTAMVRLLAEGLYTGPGISPPELVGRVQGCFESVTQHLADRGVVFERREEVME